MTLAKSLHFYSIPVSVGSAVTFYFYAEQNFQLFPHSMLVGLLTFTLYGVDHFLDTRKSSQFNSQFKAIPILSLAILALLFVAVFFYAHANPFTLPFIALCALAAPPTWVYFKATHYIKSQTIGANKEWIIALIACYVMCMIPQILQSKIPGLESLLFLLICLHNTYLCSQIDYYEDLKNKQHTFATQYGLKGIKKITWLLIALGFMFWFFMLFKNQYTEQIWVMGSMVSSLFICQIATNQLNNKPTIFLKLWADSIFLYPLLSFIY